MKFTLKESAPGEKTDLLVLPIAGKDGLTTDTFRAHDVGLDQQLTRICKEQGFEGKDGQSLCVDTLGKLPAGRIALFGFSGALDSEKVLTYCAQAIRQGNDCQAKTVTISLPESVGADLLHVAIRGAKLGAYRFNQYRSDKGRGVSVEHVVLLSAQAKASALKKELALANAVTDAVALARDLINTPSLDLYPESLAERARKVATASKLASRVLTERELKKSGMNLILGVGAGSQRPPRLVHLTYNPKGAKGQPIVLVGKGITFDSGGLSLKPSASMEDMKIDMSGSAAVLGALQAIAALKPKVVVHGIMALAENMPSGTAIRPGDVIKSAKGKTVEINNTDAEGRLVLADALHYACGLKPRCIIDLATLTGACMVALGPTTVGLFSNDDALAQSLLESSRREGEDFWRLPLTAALKDQLKSDIADLKNTGDRLGGAITAALFLREFVDQGSGQGSGQIPWAHLDIAGPASSKKDIGHLSKGGTGVGVATLVDYILRQSA